VRLYIQVEGREYEVDVDTMEPPAQPEPCHAPDIPDAVMRNRPPQRLPEDAVCASPIAGRVVAVLAGVGQEVRRNEPVVILEAMKMEIPIGPAVDGTVNAVFVQAGDLVRARQPLFELA
jgi:biotin carboxyl carrier protein